MKIIVDAKNYTNYKYDEYYDDGTPENNPYVVGQVVVIPNESHDDPKNNFVLAVVLGIITKDEVRTDVHGMVAIEDIRPANVTDFGKSNITFIDALYKECQGYKVSRDFDNFKWIIEKPNSVKYYQPDFGDDDTLVTPDGVELWSYYVYSSMEKAKEDFPDRKINTYSEGDIEEPYIIK
jgi:hypothetical protein